MWPAGCLRMSCTLARTLMRSMSVWIKSWFSGGSLETNTLKSTNKDWEVGWMPMMLSLCEEDADEDSDPGQEEDPSITGPWHHGLGGKLGPHALKWGNVRVKQLSAVIMVSKRGRRVAVKTCSGTKMLVVHISNKDSCRSWGKNWILTFLKVVFEYRSYCVRVKIVRAALHQYPIPSLYPTKTYQVEPCEMEFIKPLSNSDLILATWDGGPLRVGNHKLENWLFWLTRTSLSHVVPNVEILQ
jgi:hypothetical protein